MNAGENCAPADRLTASPLQTFVLWGEGGGTPNFSITGCYRFNYQERMNERLGKNGEQQQLHAEAKQTKPKLLYPEF